MYLLVSPLKGILQLHITAWGKKKTRMMGLPGQERGLTIYSSVWIQLHECERWKHYSWNFNII